MNISVKTAEAIALSLHKIEPEVLRSSLKISDEAQEIGEKEFIDFLSSKQGEKLKERFDAGHKKAQSETLSKFEKEIRKTHNIGDDVELTGIELINHLIESKSDNTDPKKKGGISDDDVKKHALYLDLEKKAKEELASLRKSLTDELENERNSRAYEKQVEEINSLALSYFNEIGEADLPADKNIQDRQIKLLLIDQLHSGLKYSKQENGEFLITKADGSRLEDAAGNAVGLKDFVIQKAKENFNFKATGARPPAKAAGGASATGGGSGTKLYKGPAPKNRQEYTDMLLNGSIPLAERNEIRETYSAQFNKAEE